ncbi:MAG: hypothetical protein JXR81_04180 [Candidatus Goldbacteria bacterium]|nr:hypothetical protein [Candidatus Goldiibacteriota bacterium]
MKNLMIKLLLFVFMFISPVLLQASDDGGAAGGFLYAGGSGARSAGLANSSSADSSDASGAYFNPALVTSVKYTELSFYYMTPSEGIAYNVISFALPVREYGILAFSRVELEADGVERITDEGIKTGDFSDRSDCYMLTYAYPFTESFSAGLTLKLVTRSFDTYNSNGFGIDAGTTYNFGDVFTVSVSLLNITRPVLKIGSIIEDYPMNMRAGGALYLFDTKLVLLGDALFINILSDGRDFMGNDGKVFIRYSGGLEYRPFDFAAIRGGINQAGPAVGGGVTTENFTLDYAATFAVIGVVHNFGVTARFGEVPTEREKKLIQEKSGLIKDKEKMSENFMNVTYGQLYLSALNHYNTGNYEKAQAEVKALLSMKTGDESAEKLSSDITLMLNRKAAGVKFDEAAALLAKGETKKGIEMIKNAEKVYPGIKDAKIKEYMANGSKEIEERRYMDARQWYEKVLAIDPSNAKAAEMLGKIRDLIDMSK